MGINSREKMFINSYILLAVIFFLFVYIFILHFLIYKKSKEIKSILLKLSNFEQKEDKDQIIKYVKSYIEGLTASRQITKGELIKDDRIREFIFENTQNSRVFIHYTSTELVARKIVSEGFKFIDTFHKTAESVNKDDIELVYKHSIRRLYGNFVIVICVGNKVFEYYLNELKNRKKDNTISVEQILVKHPPSLNDNDEEEYIFPKEYIKGYFNYETGEIIKNKVHNPLFDSEIFRKNLERA